MNKHVSSINSNFASRTLLRLFKMPMNNSKLTLKTVVSIVTANSTFCIVNMLKNIAVHLSFDNYYCSSY